MSDRVSCVISNGVADVRMTRPDKMNALDSAMFIALIEVGERLKVEPGLRAVVLSGEGRAFCAGLDMSSFAAMASGPDPAETAPTLLALSPGGMTHRAQQVCWVWQELPVPVIAAVHGVALGGGAQIALGADIRIVAPDVKMSILEIKWGLIPDMTGTVRLAQLVRPDVAMELTTTGRMVDGEEAVRIGLATRVSATPLVDALNLAAEIAGKSPTAIRAAKELLRSAYGGTDAATQLAEERRVIRTLIGRPDQIEAISAAMGNRPAIYRD